ncbi:NAD(P)H-dependent D-xylose reductase (XR) [Brettanomyces nanus]|uniref:NAD(P)H-dependent D-xylose reductase (XR) n=1 Tax=Eeniella nana TaxID=13502 RepID=A0A875S6U9_EENNA|nr:NAD(P)H-dependent D-xylose reductase (XR) [Brettanomyces nanus]QPG75712.1 NAD(P)H-dependent D-xylose reductase (XR) [Brettanomyces nanus]
MPKLITLNNGVKIPQVGFGCWKVPKDICPQQIYDAIKVGYRMFDGATDYGNEKEVGKGLRKAIADGIVKREDLVIVSKLWNSYHSPKNVKLVVNKILSDLGLDYLDVLYMHFPIAQKFVPIEERYPPGFFCGTEGVWEYENVPIAVTWAAMENLVKEGLVKSIGISNSCGAVIQDLLRGCKIRPQLLQIEHHPYLVQKRLVEYVQAQGIVIVAYSSFGPQSFVEMDNPMAVNCPKLFDNPTIKKIAQAHKVSAAQVLLRWSTQNGICVIPKSSKKERLLSNLQSDKFNLTEAELNEIDGLNRNLRFNDPWDWSDDPKTKIPTFI